MAKDRSKLGPHGRRPMPVLRDRFQEIVDEKTKQGLVTTEPVKEMVVEKEPANVYDFKCAACGSSHYTERHQGNGIIGPGYHAGVVELVCACGIKYSSEKFTKKPAAN